MLLLGAAAELHLHEVIEGHCEALGCEHLDQLGPVFIANRMAVPHRLRGDVLDPEIGAQIAVGFPEVEHVIEGGKLLRHALHDTLCIGKRNTLRIAVNGLWASMSETPADRLRKLRIARGYATAKEAADAFGWNEVTYRSHENGTRNIPVSSARKYGAALGKSAAHILGIGGGRGNGGELTQVNPVINAPVFARVSAGAFRYDEGLDEGAISQVPVVPRQDIPAQLQYALIVDGSSVNLRIPDGAYAICVPFDSYPGGAQHGQLVHVVRERSGLHEHTIKELRFSRDGMSLVPVSSDPRYQEKVKLSSGEGDEIVRIHGIVIGSYQPL